MTWRYVFQLAALAVMALQGIWLLPPWWAPYVFAAALAVAAAASAATRTLKRWMPGFRVIARGVGNPMVSISSRWTEAPLGGDPRPVQFDGRSPVRGNHIVAP